MRQTGEARTGNAWLKGGGGSKLSSQFILAEGDMFSFLDSTFLVPSLKSLKLQPSHLLAINVLQTCLSALHLFKERGFVPTLALMLGRWGYS